MKVGDRIRIQLYSSFGGHKTDIKDYIIEEFRYCLGVFLSNNDRTAERFTPLCNLYEPSAKSETKYISNYGEYTTNMVQAWMDLPPIKEPK